jgi:hypothetical protein
MWVSGETAEGCLFSGQLVRREAWMLLCSPEMATKKKPGLWANIQKKRKRIEKGSGERMRKKGEKGAPSQRSLKRAQAGSRRKKKSA